MQLWIRISLSVVIVDQLTKQLADNLLVYQRPLPIIPFFNLTLTYNQGAAFSFLADAGGWQRWFFLVLSLIISLGLIVWLIRLGAYEKRLAAGLSLILGGAVGNLIDRVVYGYVIDFIDVYYAHWHWPAFNIADSAITIGAILLIMDSLFIKSIEEKRIGHDDG